MALATVSFTCKKWAHNSCVRVHAGLFQKREITTISSSILQGRNPKATHTPLHTHGSLVIIQRGREKKKKVSKFRKWTREIRQVAWPYWMSQNFLFLGAERDAYRLAEVKGGEMRTFTPVFINTNLLFFPSSNPPADRQHFESKQYHKSPTKSRTKHSTSFCHWFSRTNQRGYSQNKVLLNRDWGVRNLMQLDKY